MNIYENVIERRHQVTVFFEKALYRQHTFSFAFANGFVSGFGSFLTQTVDYKREAELPEKTFIEALQSVGGKGYNTVK
ncbi:hypothetical protein [Niabella drilacis]|uniref:hypothetical protein n=1 Tax=Niabella drilacis (strain DSM 25811 / CCM 8410 / CCUG 62505 / LMG 26954 / E90) TaxID=1285928 RepID=UPI00115FF1F0|nr:hypothetical protein [Niabella drilacis]